MAKHGEAGFTLVEMLVGLTLLGLIMAVLAGALRTGLVGIEAVDARAERLSEMRVTQAFIRRHLEAARPVSWLRKRRPVVAFEGQSEEVSFMAAMAEWPNAGALYLVRLAREGSRLVMIRRITSGEPERFDFGRHVERVTLATGIAGLRFSFFGPTPDQRTAKWHERWRDQAAMPDLVRLDIDYADPAAGEWAPLLVTTMIERQPR